MDEHKTVPLNPHRNKGRVECTLYKCVLKCALLIMSAYIAWLARLANVKPTSLGPTSQPTRK